MQARRCISEFVLCSRPSIRSTANGGARAKDELGDAPPRLHRRASPRARSLLIARTDEFSLSHRPAAAHCDPASDKRPSGAYRNAGLRNGSGLLMFPPRLCSGKVALACWPAPSSPGATNRPQATCLSKGLRSALHPTHVSACSKSWLDETTLLSSGRRSLSFEPRT